MMKAWMSKQAKLFLKSEKNGRKLLKELYENDNCDDKPIKTSFGKYKKLKLWPRENR